MFHVKQRPETVLFLPSPGFADECRRQTALAAAADRAESGLVRFVDAALEDLGTWE